LSAISGIEWTDATWNPVTGCTKVSPGCDHCYAETLTERFHGTGSFTHITLHDDRLAIPVRWRRPRRVFVNSMSDLFHDAVPDDFLACVWAVMATTPAHTYQVLTKRHARMRSLLSSVRFINEVCSFIEFWGEEQDASLLDFELTWPVPHVWLGVSAEDHKRAQLRVPALLDTPAAVRFLSCEPLLGPVDLRPWIREKHPPGTTPPPMSWVITGGESGRQARPAHPDWFRQIRDDCLTAGVAYFHKQHGEWREPTRGEDYDTTLGRAGHPPALLIDHDGTVHCSREAAGAAAVPVIRVGKKAAGRKLDGRIWEQHPQAVTA
jgi:protein gp37